MFVYNNLNECFICLESVSQPCNLAQNKCGHVFHKECLYEWVNSTHNHRGYVCPVCNTPIKAEKKITKLCNKNRNLCVIL